MFGHCLISSLLNPASLRVRGEHLWMSATNRSTAFPPRVVEVHRNLPPAKSALELKRDAHDAPAFSASLAQPAQMSAGVPSALNTLDPS